MRSVYVTADQRNTVDIRAGTLFDYSQIAYKHKKNMSPLLTSCEKKIPKSFELKMSTVGTLAFRCHCTRFHPRSQTALT